MCLAQPDPPPKEPIPIDGGLIYLILGGLAIGIKKIMDHRKKS
ncbi:MAG: PID-CTERM protein-sorting domain-containing protein [Candidatus Cyclobacteriaceae bacterium M3_2C_046]